MSKIVIDPLTRISGALKIEVIVENNKIKDANVSGSQFRGFELMFKDRDPFDVIRLSPRICGICSTHHALASTLSIENLMNVNPDYNGKIIRDIANAFEFLQNHIRHIYFFVMPGYVKVADNNPLFKTTYFNDYRLNDIESERINKNYIEAIRYSRDAHKGIAILAGKAPHCHGIWVGGTTTTITLQQLEQLKYLIYGIKKFVLEKLITDVEIIANAYSDYFLKGKGHGNLMSYNSFEGYGPQIKYLDKKVRINDVEYDFDIKNIDQSIKSTWVTSITDKLIPGVSQPPVGNPNKPDAYSWISAPRYKGYAMEVGALARMTLSGNYKGGISVMDRIVAKSYEAKRFCEIIEELINLMQLGKPYQRQWDIPMEGRGIGLLLILSGIGMMIAVLVTGRNKAVRSIKVS